MHEKVAILKLSYRHISLRISAFDFGEKSLESARSAICIVAEIMQEAMIVCLHPSITDEYLRITDGTVL